MDKFLSLDFFASLLDKGGLVKAIGLFRVCRLLGICRRLFLHISAMAFVNVLACRAEGSSKKRLRMRLVKFGLSRSSLLGKFWVYRARFLAFKVLR